MADLRRTIDPAGQSSGEQGKLNPQDVEAFLSGLPSFDLEARIAGLDSLLAKINTNSLNVDEQRVVLARLAPEIDELIADYSEQIHQYALPIPAKRHQRYVALQTLLGRGAAAYKRLIHDGLNDQSCEIQQHELREAVLRCIGYLGQQALQAYAVYREAPPQIWKDLHLLYAYSEQKQLATDVVEHLSELTIGGAYARVLLLALADPAHMLQGEIYSAYEKLAKWGLAVAFEHVEELPPGQQETLITGRYFVDLQGERPPGFAGEGVRTLPGNPRLLQLSEVLRIIDSRMKGLALESRRSLKVRAEWELLLRLRQAWEKRLVREETRKIQHGTTVKAIVNLSSCHYYFSGYQPFEPEKAEIGLHGEDFKNPQTLSLLDMEATPWLDADTESKLEAGVIKPRAYCFDVEGKEDDVWAKSHVKSKRDTALEKNLDERRLETVFEFKLTNSSEAGQGLETLPDTRVQFRVGELIAMFPLDEAEDEPHLHVVRWIQCDSRERLQLGVKRIDGVPAPLAVRSLDDAAAYKDYARAFLVEAADRASLIVPAGQFDSGMLVLANDGEALRFLKLEQLLENTRAFSCFSVSYLDSGDIATTEVVNTLQALLRRDTS